MSQLPSIRPSNIPTPLIKKGTKLTRGAKRILRGLGPGLITGASDDDPSGIGAYSQAGAQLGLGIGWTVLLTYPLMVAIQEISARIGRISGHGIAGNVCRNFPASMTWALIVMLFVANAFNVAADLGVMADSLKLLIGGPAALYVIIFGTVSVLAPVLFEYKRYVAFLKWLTLSLFAYIVAFAAVHVPWIEAAKGLLVRKVSLDATFLTTLVAVLGTTISPYLFVWQASQEAEDRRVDKNGSKTSLMRKGPAAKVPGQLKKILGQFPRPGFLLRNRSEASSVYRQGDRSAVSPPLTYRVAP